jgi:hypothetical protein
MPNLIRGLRYGVRILVKSPGFSMLAVTMLALGIGANTAVSRVVNVSRRGGRAAWIR